MERRSWLHPLRSFWRVYAFHLYVLHVMVCLAALGLGLGLANPNPNPDPNPNPNPNPNQVCLAACTTRTGVVINGKLLQALCDVLITHSSLGGLRLWGEP